MFLLLLISPLSFLYVFQILIIIKYMANMFSHSVLFLYFVIFLFILGRCCYYVIITCDYFLPVYLHFCPKYSSPNQYHNIFLTFYLNCLRVSYLTLKYLICFEFNFGKRQCSHTVWWFCQWTFSFPNAVYWWKYLCPYECL